jgi:hypothetical protein
MYEFLYVITVADSANGPDGVAIGGRGFSKINGGTNRRYIWLTDHRILFVFWKAFYTIIPIYGRHVGKKISKRRAGFPDY